jgi:hypothetical protein
MELQPYKTTTYDNVKLVHANILKFAEDNNADIVRIKDIKVPPLFSNTIPHFSKLTKYRKILKNTGCIDKPITVVPEYNERGKPTKLLLVDGYIRYILCQEIGMKYIPVVYQNEYIL